MRARFLVVFFLVGCTSTVEEPYEAPVAELAAPPGTPRAPSNEELKKLVDLAELVVSARVLQRRVAPDGVNYTLEVQEVLNTQSEAKAISVGDVVRVSAFLYRAGRPMGRIGDLKELDRYLFFLTPMEEKGWWLHLDDAAGLMLPDAEETLRALRVMRAESDSER